MASLHISPRRPILRSASSSSQTSSEHTLYRCVFALSRSLCCLFVFSSCLLYLSRSLCLSHTHICHQRRKATQPAPPPPTPEDQPPKKPIDFLALDAQVSFPAHCPCCVADGQGEKERQTANAY